jgi:hypothetical protein
MFVRIAIDQIGSLADFERMVTVGEICRSPAAPRVEAAPSPAPPPPAPPQASAQHTLVAAHAPHATPSQPEGMST